MEGIEIREATPYADAEGVRSLLAPEMSLYRRRFGDFVIERLIREAAVFVVATRADISSTEGDGEGKEEGTEFEDGGDGAPLAVLSACFDPCSGGGMRSDEPVASKLFQMSKSRFSGCSNGSQSSTMWMLLFAVSPDLSEKQQMAVTQALFRRAFEIAARAQRMWLLTPPGEPSPEGALTAPIRTISGVTPLWHACDLLPVEPSAALEGKSEDAVADDEEVDPTDPLASVLPMLSGWGLAQCLSESVLPSLVTRRAREEDCDDVAPVFEAKSDVTRQSFGSFFLADAVRRQGGGRSAVVGCDPYTHRAVALAAASDAPPLRLLRGAFDLAPFGGLLRPSEVGAAVGEAAAVEASRRRSDWLAVLEEHGNELGGVFGAAARRSRLRLVKEVRSEVEREGGDATAEMTQEREDELVSLRLQALGMSEGEEWCFAQELCALLDRRGPAWGWEGAGKLGSAALAALCSAACTGVPDRDAWPISRDASMAGPTPEQLVHLQLPESPVARVDVVGDGSAGADAEAADPAGAGAEESKAGEPTDGAAADGAAAAEAPPATVTALPTPEEAGQAVTDKMQGEANDLLMKSAADHQSQLPARPLLQLATSNAAAGAACRQAGAIDPNAVIRRDDLDGAVADFAAARQRRRRRARLAALWSWGRNDSEKQPASGAGDDDAEASAEGSGDGAEGAAAGPGAADATTPDDNRVWSAIEREIGALVEAELQSRREAAAARAEAAAAEAEARRQQQEAARAEAAVLGDDDEDEDDDDAGFSPRTGQGDDDANSMEGDDDASRVGELDDLDDLDDLEDQRPVVVSLRALGQALDAVAAEEGWPWSVDDEVDDENVDPEDGLRRLGPGMALLCEAGDLLEQAAGAGIIEGTGWAPGVNLTDAEGMEEAQHLESAQEPMGTAESISGCLALPDRIQLAMRLWAGEAATGEAGAPRVLVFSSEWEAADRSVDEAEVRSVSEDAAREEARQLAAGFEATLGSLEGEVARSAAAAAGAPCICVGEVLAQHAANHQEKVEAAAKAAAEAAAAAIAAAAKGKGKGKKGKKGKKKKKAKTDDEAGAPQSIADAAAAAVDAEENQAAMRGPFAPIAQRLRKPDCKAGFVLFGLPRTEAGQRELAACLLSSGVSPTCCFVAASGGADSTDGKSRRKKLPALPHAPPLSALAPCTYIAENALDGATAGGIEWQHDGVLAAMVREGVVAGWIEAGRTGRPLTSASAQAAAEVEEDEEEDWVRRCTQAADAGETEPAHPRCTAVAITLHACAPEWEARAPDLLPAIFERYPSADFVVLTLPPSAPRPAISRPFVRALPVDGASGGLQQHLWICSRAAIQAAGLLSIRRITEDDVPKLQGLAASVAAYERSTPGSGDDGGASGANAGAAVTSPLLSDVVAIADPGQEPAGRPGQGLSSLRGYVVETTDPESDQVDVVGCVVLSSRRCKDAAGAALCRSFELDGFDDPAQALDGSLTMVQLRHCCIDPVLCSSAPVGAVLAMCAAEVNARLVVWRGEETVVAPVDSDARAASLDPEDDEDDGNRPGWLAAGAGGGACFVRPALSVLQPVPPRMLAPEPQTPLPPAGVVAEEGVSSAPSGGWSDPRALRHPLSTATQAACLRPRTEAGARVVFVGCSDAALAAVSEVRQAYHVLNCVMVSPTGLAGTPGAAGAAMAADTALSGCSINDRLAREARYEGVGQSGADAAGDEEEMGELDRETRKKWVAPIVPRSGFGARELVRLGLGPGCVDVWRVSGTAEKLDRARRVLSLSDGREINYDLLILATGLREGGAERAVARGRQGSSKSKGGMRSLDGEGRAGEEDFKRGVLAALKPGHARRAAAGGAHENSGDARRDGAPLDVESDADEDELTNEQRARPWPAGVHAVATPEEVANLCRDISALVSDCPNGKAMEELEGAAVAVREALAAARAAAAAGIEAAAEVPAEHSDGNGSAAGGEASTTLAGPSGRGEADDDDDAAGAGGGPDGDGDQPRARIAAVADPQQAADAVLQELSPSGTAVFCDDEASRAGAEPPEEIASLSGRDVLICGNGISALTAARGLVARGVDPARIAVAWRGQMATALLPFGRTQEDADGQGADGDGPEFPALAVAQSLTDEGVCLLRGWRLQQLGESSSHGHSSEAVRFGARQLWVELRSTSERSSNEAVDLAQQLKEAGLDADGNEVDLTDIAAAGGGGGDVLGDEEDDEREARRRLRRERLHGANSAAGAPRVLRLHARLVISSGHTGVGRDVFRLANQSGLVFDGRLVVGHRFETADPAILATGPAARFSRRFRPERPLEGHDSRECGAAAAKRVIELVQAGLEGTGAVVGSSAAASGAGGDAAPTRGRTMLPPLGEPISEQAALPGHWTFSRARLVAWTPPPAGKRRVVGYSGDGEKAAESVDLDAAGALPSELWTTYRYQCDKKPRVDPWPLPVAAERHTWMAFDQHGRIAELVVLQRGLSADSERRPRSVAPPPMRSLIRFIGRHVSWLRGAERGVASGRIPCLAAHLFGPWGAALRHDKCEDLVGAIRYGLVSQATVQQLALLSQGADRDEVDAAVEDVRRSISDEAIFGPEVDMRAQESMQKMEDAAVVDRSAGGKTGLEGSKRLASDSMDRMGFTGVGGERIPPHIRERIQRSVLDFIRERSHELAGYVVP